MKKKLLLAPAVTLPLLYPILQFSISGYGTPVFPMISKIRPSMPAQTMFDIILTSFCSLPATHWGIYPLGLIWRHYRWEQYGGSIDYVRCILLYSFWMVALWMCCCGCMYFIGVICVVSSCWDSTSTSFLAKSSCSPWQPFRKINKDRALYVFLLHFLAAVELIYTNGSVGLWCLTYSVSICQYVFPCCNNTYSLTRCLIRRKLHLHESSQVVLSF